MNKKLLKLSPFLGHLTALCAIYDYQIEFEFMRRFMPHKHELTFHIRGEGARAAGAFTFIEDEIPDAQRQREQADDMFRQAQQVLGLRKTHSPGDFDVKTYLKMKGQAHTENCVLAYNFHIKDMSLIDRPHFADFVRDKFMFN